MTDKMRHIPIAGIMICFRSFLIKHKSKADAPKVSITAALSGMDVINARAIVNTIPDSSIGRFMLC